MGKKKKKDARDDAAHKSSAKLNGLAVRTEQQNPSVAVPLPAPPLALPASAAPAKATPPAPLEKPIAATKTTVKRTTSPKAKAVTPRKTPAKRKPSISTDDIALRAYFIAEKRRNHGLHGDEHQDWIEAERQLRAEAAKASRARKTA